MDEGTLGVVVELGSGLLGLVELLEVDVQVGEGEEQGAGVGRARRLQRLLQGCLGALQIAAAALELGEGVPGQRERRSVKGSSKLLKTLREQVSAATDVEPPDPVKLRRISRKGILTLVLVFMFASALIPLLTGVDYASVQYALGWRRKVSP